MNRSWWIRFITLKVFVVVAIVMMVPTLFNVDASKWRVSKKMNLGLDLQGGLYMVLGIDFNKVYRDEVVGSVRKADNLLKESGISVTPGALDVADPTDPQQSFVINGDLNVAKDKLNDYFGYTRRLVGEKDHTLIYGLGREYKREIESSAVSKSIEVIRNRIDEFGVTEPEIISQGQDRIVVQLPGVKDIDRAKELIGKTAKLEFRFVHNEITDAQMAGWMDKIQKSGNEYKKGTRFSEWVAQINESLKAEIPAGYQLFFSKQISKTTNEITQMTPYLLESAASLTGEEVQEATVRIDQQQNRPYVGIDFKASGAKIFEEITAKNVGRRMAIVLDGNVYSAPVIQERIAGGSAQVTLGYGDYNDLLSEARDLALVLRAGALPVELEFQEQRVVGPSLGADAIQRAEVAAAAASLMVFLFVVFYYRTSGVFASITLVVNVLLGLACLVALEATLTLPGIAGIALTVGMAVDGNIIIYERIKEELAKGRGGREAVAIGFDKAFWTILDANVTTALAGLCLLNFGTGPVRGFAVTLLIGIFTTVYTSYFVTKLLFDWYVSKNRQTLSI